MKEFEKLSDDMLENISGGTNSEMLDIKDALHAENLREILDGLKAHGITAELSTLEKNSYEDRNTGKELSHEEVLFMLKGK